MDLTTDFSGLFTPQGDELGFEALMDRVQELEERVAMQSIDRLTGVLSTDEFHSAVKRILKEYPNENLVMWRFDIDKFQTVNNLFGVDEGNRLLIYCAKYLLSRIRRDRSTALGRMGGDVFCGITPYTSKSMSFGDDGTDWLTSGPTIASMENFLKGFRDDFRFSVSIGFYQIENHNDPIEIMYSRALAASKACKDNSEQIFSFYDRALNLAIEEKQVITAEMHTALENGEFTVFLQPKVRLSDLSLVGAEALVRWIHPKKGRIPPDSFIPIFEENGFITKLDLYVLRRCCAYIQSWMRQKLNVIPLSVNLSQMDLSTPGLPFKIQAVLEEYKVAAKYIHLEITESAYADDVEQVNGVTQTFKDLGFHLEMDDFGKGYSSLNMIAELPIDTLKLDMGFLQGDQKSSGKVISFVTALARHMELTTVAEGIETQEQLAFLRSINCDCGQGYLFSKPLPKSDFDAYMRECEIGVMGHKVKNVDKTIAEYQGWKTHEIWEADSNFSKMFNAFAGGVGICEFNLLGNTLRLARYNDLLAEAMHTTRSLLLSRTDTLEPLIHPDDLYKLHDAMGVITDPKDWAKDTGVSFTDVRLEVIKMPNFDENGLVIPEEKEYTWCRIKWRMVDFNTETRTYVIQLNDINDMHRTFNEMAERMEQVEDLERQMMIYTHAGIAGTATLRFCEGEEPYITYANKHFMELHTMGHLYETLAFPFALSKILPEGAVAQIKQKFQSAIDSKEETFQWIVPREDLEGVFRNTMSNGRLRYEKDYTYAEVVVSTFSDASTLETQLNITEQKSREILQSTEITYIDLVENKVHYGYDLQLAFGVPEVEDYNLEHGFPSAHMFHPDTVVHLEKMVAELLVAEGTRSLDLWMRHQNFVDYSLRRGTFFSSVDENGKVYRISGVGRDITLERYGRENVTMAQIATHMPDGLLVFSKNSGKLLFANATFYNIVGLNPQRMESEYKNYPLLLAGDEYSPNVVLPEISENEKNFTREFQLRNHAMRWVEFIGMCRGDFIYATVRDITHRQQLQVQLDRETGFNEVLNNISDELLFRVNINDSNVLFSGKSAVSFGIDMTRSYSLTHPEIPFVADEFIESYQEMTRDIQAGVEKTYDLQLKNTNNNISWYRFEYRIIHEAGDPAFAIGKAVNIDYQVGLLEKLERDPMTGCYNASAMKMRSNQILNASFPANEDLKPEGDSRHALLIVTLNNFAGMTDKISFHHRDDLITQISQMINNKFRESDLVGRIQDDVFAIFMRNVPNRTMPLQKVSDLYLGFQHFNTLNGGSCQVEVTIRCSYASHDGINYPTLLENTVEIPVDVDIL